MMKNGSETSLFFIYHIHQVLCSTCNKAKLLSTSENVKFRIVILCRPSLSFSISESDICT